MRAILAAICLSLTLTACARAEDAAPAWGQAALDDLAAVAASARAEGLAPETAALDELARFRHLAETDPVAEAQTDVAADALFSALARAFAQGGTDPRVADPEWRIEVSPAPDLEGLRRERAEGALPSALLRPLLPQSAEYAALREALAQVSAETPGATDSDGLVRETRIGALRASLERWRWLPRDLPERRIEVRIAQFEARMIAPDATPVSHAVIVGARATPTPSFESLIRSVTLNPSWEPPPSIAAELTRRFRRDPQATAREGFDVIGADGAIIAPEQVNWAARPFRYRLLQRPGPGNALGQIRFDMPNSFAIYLHDTPNRALFDRPVRALSHGCIRVQAPDALAETVLAGEWTREALNEAIATGETQAIALSDPLPVLLVYVTATLNGDGDIAYAEDIYRRDTPVVAALDGPDAALVRRAVTPTATCPG
jgi:murein L,D-transpeptidase YcbB/YkuD